MLDEAERLGVKPTEVLMGLALFFGMRALPLC
jgi:hypothetical protein